MTPLAADPATAWLDDIAFDPRGLVTVVAQDADTQRVLMVAWADRAALAETAATGRAVYYSRSRGRLWRKGEQSGHWQDVAELRLDCDADVVIYMVRQHGGIACHTGRQSCFYRRLQRPDGVPVGRAAAAGGRSDGAAPAAAAAAPVAMAAPTWQPVDPVLMDPARIYRQ
jgi:phosphoribosyl-AMP cyclohydrolase